MFFKGSIRDSVQKHGITGKPKEERCKRNYDRFFEGYTEICVPKKNKVGYVTKKFYAGARYCPDMGAAKYYLNCIMYAILYLVSGCSVIMTGMRAAAVNAAWYVGLAQAVCLFFLGWAAVALIYYFAGGRKRTVYMYKSMKKHFRYAFCGLTVAFVALIGMNVIWVLTHLVKTDGMTVIGIVCNLCGLAAVLMIRYRENSVNYQKVTGTEALPKKCEGE